MTDSYDPIKDAESILRDLHDEQTRDLWPIPGVDAFLEPGSDTPADYLPASDLEDLRDHLYARHPDLLSPLTDYTVRVLWRRAGGTTNGAATLGKCQKASGLLRYWSDADWVIWLAADHFRELGASAHAVEACLFHELCHAEIDPQTGKPGIRAHDYTGFCEELLRYGAWHDDLKRMSETVRQLPLTGLEAGR